MDTHNIGPAAKGHGAIPVIRGLQTIFANATGTATSDATAPATGSTVTIGSTVYTFRTSLTTTATAYEVLIGGTAAAALTNLKAAINRTGTPGTDYGSDTLINPDVTAGTLTATTLFVTSKTGGTANNGIGTTASSSPASHITWGAATLTGGRAAASTAAGARELLRTVGASLTNPLVVEMIEFAETAFNGTSPVVSIISYAVTDTAFASPTTEFAIASIAAGAFINKCIIADRVYRVEYTAATGSPTAGNIYSFARVAGPGYTT